MATKRTKTAKPTPASAQKLYAALAALYPDAHCALNHRNPFELIVATILSAQCTDERVNMVTPGLFEKYPTPRAMADADITELEQVVRSTGFYRNKAKNIKAASTIIAVKHGGNVPQTMDELLELPGVARKTANVVLGNAFGKNVGVVVDTHVGRLSNRLGLTQESDPVKIEQDLMKLIPRDNWTMLSHLLISHGRAVCDARKPVCSTCQLAAQCPKIGVEKSA
jgi:endonuclease-3